jgi:hypothetical protein
MSTGGYRIITVVLRIKDKDAASAIWDAHANWTEVAGCEVISISNGDTTIDDDEPEQP